MVVLKTSDSPHSSQSAPAYTVQTWRPAIELPIFLETEGGFTGG